jgi:TonB family protein
MEVLSDTQGVDVGPYLRDVLERVRKNWYPQIPAGKSGKVVIQFTIKHDGKALERKLLNPSGDVPLDRAAWGAINTSSPFAPLPPWFPSDLALRLTFQN